MAISSYSYSGVHAVELAVAVAVGLAVNTAEPKAFRLGLQKHHQHGDTYCCTSSGQIRMHAYHAIDMKLEQT